MECLDLFVVFAIIVELVSGEISEHDRKVLDSEKDVADNTTQETAKFLEDETDATTHKWDIIQNDIMDYGDLGDETVTEFLGVDENGCDRKLKNHFQDRCDEVYDKINEKAQTIEDEKKRAEALCCALEDFEKCSLKAFDQANCVTDKKAIRENLKAARLFLTVISGITCSEFRGQCAEYHSAAATGYYSYIMILVPIGLMMIGSFL